MAPFATSDDIVAGLSHQDPALVGSGIYFETCEDLIPAHALTPASFWLVLTALAQLRHACTIHPTPKPVLDYLRADATASAVSNALSLAREVRTLIFVLALDRFSPVFSAGRFTVKFDSSLDQLPLHLGSSY